ncbi:ATP-binding protein [Maridesulfovibrio sp.]|uniref:ATP-binding protein n=1 Tax=Maridesulfovibrio sp. TaxID=2795000 RepID=UPI0029CA84BA|nr:ATP-binding protein [Maridesulfovibrio sp.]
MHSVLRLVLSALCGVILLCLLSAAQKYLMGWPMPLKSFIAPILFGLFTGSGFYFYSLFLEKHRKTKGLLYAREAQLNTVLSAAPIGIGMVTDRVFQEVNDFFCEMTGYSRAELIGSSSRMIYPSDEDYDYVSSYKYSQIKDKGSGTVETRFKRKDGKILHVILSSKPLNQADWSQGVSFTVLNITKRKEAENSLAKRIVFESLVSKIATDFLNLSVDQIDEGLTKSLEDICRFAGVGRAYIFLMRGNSAVCDNTHEWCAENIEPQIDVLQNINLQDPETLLWEKLCNKESYYIPDVSALPDDLPDKAILAEQDIWSILIEPMYFNDQLVGFVGFDAVYSYRHWSEEDIDILSLFSKNISLILERKKVEEKLIAAKQGAEAANTAKSEFLANMSHEVRTPLNGIMGMLQLMQISGLRAEQDEHCTFAMESCRRLTRLLSDVLDISKIEAGNLQIINVEFDLGEVLNSVYYLFKPVALQKNVDLIFDVAGNLPQKLSGDSNRLHQILNNLIGNALKFTDAGSVVLEVSPLKVNQPGLHKILFSVSDSGIGISDNKLENIFDSFTQVDNSRTRSYEGAGLGLAIVKKLVKLMGGSLSITSELGVGTAIYFCIEFQDPQQSVAVADDLLEDGDNFIKEFNVLVAEDEKVNMLTLKSFLQKLGCTVSVAGDGYEVIEALNGEQDTFDLIFMDIQMPNMGGIETTSRIRSGDAGTSNSDIPIIACTAYAMAGDKEEFFSAGMDDYLAKPIQIGDVEEILLKYSAKDL